MSFDMTLKNPMSESGIHSSMTSNNPGQRVRFITGEVFFV